MTEPKYFEGIQQIINSKYRERIHLEICGEGCNTVNLFDIAVRRARQNPNGYKHVWIVYDTDDFPKDKVDAVPVLCKHQSTEDCQYHAIWSNQCIELWFLLHFGYMHADLYRKEYFVKLNEQFAMRGMGEYRKNRSNIFAMLLPYINIAISNAKKLAILNLHRTPSASAPGTNMHELMDVLHPWIK